MRKKTLTFILALVCLLCCSLALAACGSHEHHFTIKYDDTYHWFECDSCSDIEHKELHDTLGADGMCSACHYKKGSAENPPAPHTHTWDTALSYDAANHWYACTVAGCTEKNGFTAHDFSNGSCVCGYKQGGTVDPPVPDTGDDAFKNVAVSANGVLSWNKIKGATKYVLKITYSSESNPVEYTVDKSKTSANLNELRSEGFPAGKSSVEILVYENSEVEIDGKKYYQETLMSDVKESFRIVKINSSYSLVKLSYADENIKLDGFYAEKQIIENRSVYLYEQVLKDNKAMTFKIKNYVKAKDTNHTLYFFKSQEGRDNGDINNLWNSTELQMGYPQLQHGANYYYVQVIDNATDEPTNYDICVYGLYTLTVKRFDASFTETNGLRDYTYTPIGNDLTYTEMDIIPQNVLYGGVADGKLARTSDYKVVEKQDVTVTSDSTEVMYYFYDEATVRSDCAAYDEWSKTYSLSEYDQGWSLSCNYGKATGMVTLPDILIGKKVVSAAFYYSEISALIVEDGAETLTATFTDCWSLLDIFLPDTITSMNKNSFQGVNSNVTVHCAFTQAKANEFTTYWNYTANQRVQTEYGVTVPENALAIRDGLVYSSTDIEGELSVTSILAGFDGTIPDTLSFNGQTYKVTQILTSLGERDVFTIGKNVKTLADSALMDVQQIFVSRENQNYVIADGLLYNKDFTRLYCVADKAAVATITTLTINASVQTIPFGILSGFSNLQTLTIPFVGESRTATENTHLGYMFGATSSGNNKRAIPSSLVSVCVDGGSAIGAYAFYDCTTLRNITVSGIFSIGDYAFYNCIMIDEFEIPEGVTTIGGYAFYNCKSLTAIDIPENVSVVGTHAFGNCPIRHASIPASAAGVFSGSEYLQDLIITGGGTVESVESPSLKNIVINKGVRQIYSKAFQRCNSLQYLYISRDVLSIGDRIVDTDQCVVIYCEISNRLDGWDYNWNGNNTVIWDCETNERDSDGYAYAWIDDVKYSLKDGVATIMRHYNRKETAIEIPSTILYRGVLYCIGSIGERAFYGHSSLKNITVPEDLLDIGTLAFYDTAWYNEHSNGILYIGSVAYDYKGNKSSTTSETIQAGTKRLQSYLFSGCTALMSIEIPASVVEVGAGVFNNTLWWDSQPSGLVYVNNVAYKYKGEVLSGTTLTLRDGTRNVSDCAFEDCAGLTGITIPNSVVSIGSYAFSGCVGLENIAIPESVVSIGWNAFYYCQKLVSITVASGNLRYASQDGILYNKAKTKIICIPMGISGTVSLPPTIDSISEGGEYTQDSFAGRRELSAVVLPNAVTQINFGTFMDCSGLETVTICANVTRIKEMAFWGCSRLTTINFVGTLAQWDAIEKDSYWDEDTGDYIVVCSDGTRQKKLV